jgi:hypothetical protein
VVIFSIMKIKIIFCAFIGLFGINSMRSQIINSEGEYFSPSRIARAVVKRDGDSLAIRFHVTGVDSSRSGLDAKLEKGSGWFAFMEGDDTIWLYRGGGDILKCKVISDGPSLSFKSEKRKFDIKAELDQLPIIIRDYLSIQK